MKSNFAEHRQNRIEGLAAAAANTAKQAESLHNEAHKMAEVIPFGQPILVGHHSEKRDRNYRDRIHGKFTKSFELNDRAEELSRRAKAAANNDAIFSDDPEAITKLTEKIAKLEEDQKFMVTLNKAWRKSGVQGLIDAGLSPKQAQRIADDINAPGSLCCGQPCAPFSLSNNSANIRRLKARLEQLKKREADETTTHTIGETEIIDNVEDNRVQIFFPGKPSDEVRDMLKSHGFKWARSIGAWQRHRNPYVLRLAKQIAEKY